MPSVFFYLVATLLISLNFVRLFGLAISDWLYFTALGFAFIETLFFDKKHFHCWTKNPLFLPASLILFGAIVSSLRARDIRVAIIEIIQQIYVITLFLSLTWIMVKRGYTRLIVKAFILSGLFTSSIALIDFAFGLRLGPQLSATPNSYLWYRYAGTLGHPNKFGYFVTLTSILSLEIWINIKKSHIKKVVWGLMLGIQIFAIVLSGSVTAYLGLALGFFALLSTRTFRISFIRFVLPIIWIISLLIMGASLFNKGLDITESQYEDSIIGRSIDRVEQITAQSRMGVYREALYEISSSPFVGVGYDQMSTSGISQESRILDYSVHNSLLQNFYIGGLFSFLGWLAIYIYIAKLVMKTLKQEKLPLQGYSAIPGCAFAILIMDQFQDAIYQREKWLVFGLLVGYISWQAMHKCKVNKQKGVFNEA
jgi:O-antigen ligase